MKTKILLPKEMKIKAKLQLFFSDDNKIFKFKSVIKSVRILMTQWDLNYHHIDDNKRSVKDATVCQTQHKIAWKARF